MKNDSMRFQTLDCYQVAKEIAKLVHLAKIPLCQGSCHPLRVAA
jgi:hypothetical protein